MFKTLIKDPLLHFLLAGTLIFVVLDTLPGGNNKAVIRFDEQQLMQRYASARRITDPELLKLIWHNLSSEERQWFTDTQVQQEVLYREAKKMGLDVDDNVMRAHLINKIRFLLDDLASTTNQPSDAQIREYFENNKNDYQIPPQISFSHIFVRVENNNWQKSDSKARQLLNDAKNQQWQANDSLGKGDNFPYHKHYVNKTEQFISGHFGRVFASQLFSKSFDTDNEIDSWTGPFRSAYGSHILYITSRKKNQIPQLNTIKNRVINDYMRFNAKQKTQLEIDRLTQNYHIKIE